jgi:hypothetical protein
VKEAWRGFDGATTTDLASEVLNHFQLSFDDLLRLSEFVFRLLSTMRARGVRPEHAQKNANQGMGGNVQIASQAVKLRLERLVGTIVLVRLRIGDCIGCSSFGRGETAQGFLLR